MAHEIGIATRDVIQSLYRGVLGREASSAEIDHHVDRMEEAGLAEVIGSFLSSPEFNRTATKIPGFVAMNFEVGEPVESRLPDADLDRIWAHLEGVWSKLGDTDPLWSVITDERLRSGGVIDPITIDSFYADGAGDVSYLKAYLKRAGRRVEEFPTVVEYGCGVGRVTAWLARDFSQVRGYDISESHASAARTYLAQQHVNNVTIHVVKNRSDLSGLTNFDLFVSIIVLQHNPPPIILEILRCAFEGLNSKGVAVFQVPIYKQGYRFDQVGYWADVAVQRGMEMHFVPQRDILALADRCGMITLEIRNDHCIGMYAEAISSTFVLQKR